MYKKGELEKSMKRLLFSISFIFILLLLVGCKKETIIESNTIIVEPDIFHYKGTEQVNAITVDEDGLLYTSTFIKTRIQTSVKGEEEWEEDTQRFCMYDLEGTCIQQVDVIMGNAMIQAMILEDNTLYCVTTRLGKGLVLYAVDITTWKVTELAVIVAETEREESFLGIDDILLIDNYLYMIGSFALGESTTLVSGQLSFEQVSFDKDNAVGRISITEENPQVELLDIDFPQDMFQIEEDTLLIYYYNEEHGFGFLEFSPEEETLQEVGRKSSTYPFRNFCGCEEGYLFMKGSILHYGTLDGMEAQIGTNTDASLVMERTIIYANDFVFYYDYEDKVVERVQIKDMVKENKEIRLLINVMDTVDINGFGYRMIREEVDKQTFSLKVLAQDSDFDLYLLSSGDSNAYNLKKNGVFYPLNKVEGIEEYLDACFPYLKEIATNEEGDIWMLPIYLDIPVLFYDKEYCQEQGVDFSVMDYQEFIAFTEYAQVKNPGKIQNFKIQEEFFAQYLNLEESFDTEIFRAYAKQLKSLYEVAGEYLWSSADILPEFFYEYLAFSGRLMKYSNNIEKLGISERVDVMSLPKISEEVENMGTCIFFAVNPQSDNLEATLSYLSTLCTYLMTVENSFLLADKTTYSNTSFIQKCYELYTNGAICFSIDNEVYYNVFTQYLQGNIMLEEMVEEVERRREIYMKE